MNLSVPDAMMREDCILLSFLIIPAVCCFAKFVAKLLIERLKKAWKMVSSRGTEDQGT